jgi:hypothetical protein
MIVVGMIIIVTFLKSRVVPRGIRTLILVQDGSVCSM